MKWLELSIATTPEVVDAVAEIFHRYVTNGVAVRGDLAASEDGDGEAALRLDRPLQVSAYVPVNEDGQRLRERIEEGLFYLSQIQPLPPLEVREVDDQDWANAWKSNFTAHRVGQRTVVVPPWERMQYQARPNQIVIELDPGMAFGTGLHPTTSMCIAELEARVEPGMRVLDVGTGTGILAILAAKLGASRVVALDVDSTAVTQAATNVSANAVSSTVEVAPGSVPNSDLAPAGAFDLVVANIIARVVMELAPEFAQALRPGGTLVASGIIMARLPETERTIKDAGLRVLDVVHEGEWRTIIAQAPARPG